MQKLVYGIGAFVLVVLLIGFALPRYSRFVVSEGVDAPQATIFALVNDMRRADLWSPVGESDPNAKIVFSGPPRGVGSTVTWDGAVAGSGSQTITESRPYEFVETWINRGEPGESRTWFELAPGTDITRVRWGFEHDYGLNVIGRYFGLMVTGIIRRDYEQSIAELKELAESLPSADFADIEIEHLVVDSMDIAYLPTTAPPIPGETSIAMGRALFEVLSFIDEHGLTEAGAPISITRAYSGSSLSFDTAIPVRGVTDRSIRDASGVRIGRTYAGPVIRVKYVGAYRNLGATHRQITAYMAATGIERNGDSWESYVSDPVKIPEEDLVTYIYYPVKAGT